MSDKVSFHFSFKFSGQIWQSVFDPGCNVIVLEVRDHDSRDMFYELVDLEGPSTKRFRIDESDWWTTIYRIDFPLLLLERYTDPQDPSKKDLILYHAEKQETLKVLNQFQYLSVSGGRLLGHDPADQALEKTFELADVGVKLKFTGNKAVFPVYYAPSTESFEVVLRYMESDSPGVGCEYLEWEDYIIISYYLRLGTKFDRKLLVVKGDDELYHELQDEGLKGFASGAFFVINSQLVFIKNGNQINGIKL